MLSRCKNSVKKWVPCVLNHWYHSVHVKVFVSLGLINYRIFSFHESRIYSYIICTWRSMSWRNRLRSPRSGGRRESDCSSSVTQASASITCSSTKTSTTAPTSRSASTMKRISTIRDWIWNTATKMWAWSLKVASLSLSELHAWVSGAQSLFFWQDSVDNKSYFVLLHISWEALGRGAELLNMRKRIKMPKVRTHIHLIRNYSQTT